MATRTTSTYDPYEHAEQLGLEIHYQPIRTAHGLYIPSRRTILLRPRMRAIVERSVLAHEVQHHLLEHRRTEGVWALRQERAADLGAARALIHPEHYADVTAWSNDPAEVCRELGVTGELLLAYVRAAA